MPFKNCVLSYIFEDVFKNQNAFFKKQTKILLYGTYGIIRGIFNELSLTWAVSLSNEK